MSTAEVLSVLSLLASLSAVYISLWQTRKQVKISTSTLHAQLSSMYVGNTSLLRFVGVSAEELKLYGLDGPDVAYLCATMEIGALHYDYSDDSEAVPFQSGSFRHQLCTSEAFLKAWPLLKKIYPRSRYIDCYDATFEEIAREASMN